MRSLIYKIAMEETAAGAAWPGDEAPISILQCTFPPFDVKSVHPSVNLPRADGRPHVTPCVSVWHDGAIHFTAEETAQKTVNLRGNPHVILTTGYNQIGGLTVVVEGDAVRITDQDTLERLASVWAIKWDGSWPYQVRNGYFYLYDEDEQRVLVDSNLVFSVKPRKVFAFGRGQTRHQF